MAASMARENMSDQGLKICSVIDHISVTDSYSIESDNRGDSNVICVVINGTDKVYVYEDGRRKMILQLDSPCLGCHCYNNSDGYYCLLKLDNGSIVHYKVAKNEEQKKKKKKKKSKHKSKDKEKHCCNDPLTSDTVQEPTSRQQDIFADLLGNGEDPTTSTKDVPPSDMPSVSGEVLDPAIVHVDSENCIVVKEDNLKDFLIVNNCLVTLAELDHGWTLSVYKMREVVATATDNGDCSMFPTCDKSPVYRTYFPKAATSHSTSDPIGCFDMNQPKQEQSTNHKPCLKYVITYTTHMKPTVWSSTQSKRIVLDDILYNQLFGSECNLLDSPVILVGLPDGRIYQVALKSLWNQDNARRHSAKGESVGLSGVTGIYTGSMLYNLKESVIDIYGLDGEINQPNGSQFLILLGHQGKVVTITTGQQETNQQLCYDEHCVTGPILESCSMGSYVVYCHPRALYRISIKYSSSGAGAAGRRGNCAISTSSLGIGRVRALDVLKSTPDIQMKFMAALANGKIVLLKFPSTQSSENGNHTSRPITAVAAGQRMKALLMAINNVSVRMNSLAVNARKQDTVLEELSKACHLAGLLLGGHLVSHSASVFDIQSQCVFHDEGSHCCVTLVCRISNQSSFTLSHGWSVILCADARPSWPQEGGSSNSINQLARTVQLKDFGPGKSITIRLPLESTQLPFSFPIHLSWQLYFNLGDFISNFGDKQALSDPVSSNIEFVESGIVLTLGHSEVDIFMALRPDRGHGSTQHHDDVHTTSKTGYDWLSASLESTCNGGLLANQKGPYIMSKKIDGPVTTMVKFNKGIVETIRKTTSGRLEGFKTSEVLVLQWLFLHNPSVLAVIQGNQLNTVTMDGKRVSFVAVQKDAASAGDVEVSMTAPSYEGACQLQESIHRRLKDVLDVHIQEDVMMSRTQLQNQLRHIQDLQRRLESVEDDLTSSRGLGRSEQHLQETGQDTLEIYKRMRESR